MCWLFTCAVMLCLIVVFICLFCLLQVRVVYVFVFNSVVIDCLLHRCFWLFVGYYMCYLVCYLLWSDVIFVYFVVFVI